MSKEKTPDENILAMFDKITRERDELKIEVEYWKRLYKEELIKNIKNEVGVR